MPNNIGMIEYAGKEGEKKTIFLTAPCQHCGKIAVRLVDCPDHLQDAPPGYIVYIDEQGILQVMEGRP